MKILQHIIRRFEIPKSDFSVLDAILSKANLYGKGARLAHTAIQGMTGLARSTVYEAIARLEHVHHLIRVTRRRLWPGHNMINVYHVIIPWRRDPLYNERQTLGWGRQNFKGPHRLDPHPKHKETSPAQPAHPCSEAEATRWYTPGSKAWCHAQGKPHPSDEGT